MVKVVVTLEAGATWLRTRVYENGERTRDTVERRGFGFSDATRETIAHTVLAKLEELGFSVARPDVVLSAPGLLNDETRRHFHRQMTERYGGRFDRLMLRGDVQCELSKSAPPPEPYVFFILGTGSIFIAFNDGRQQRYGGYGSLFNEEGSAFEIGRSAIEKILKRRNGSGCGELGELLAFFRAGNEYELVRRLHEGHTKTRIASYARDLDVKAVEGNSFARRVLDDAARSVTRVLKRMTAGWENSASFLACGSMYARTAYFQARLHETAGQEFPAARFYQLDDAVDGNWEHYRRITGMSDGSLGTGARRGE